MANTGSQAEAIRDLLVQRLEIYDPTLDTTVGSPLYSQVVQPVFSALGTDPFDTDIEQFLKDRIEQEFPNISARDGDMIVDLLVRPLQLLQETLKREIQIVRNGQSVRNYDTMRLEDAKDLAGNYFTDHRTGSRTTGSVRLFYENPTYVSILPTIIFSTPTGLRFFPIRPQFFDPETMLLQRSGAYYYADVQLVAESPGSEYGVGIGEISRVVGLTNVAKVSNLNAFTPGRIEETSRTLLVRTGQSLSERTLNVKRGIVSRLFSEFPTIRNTEVVGFGDPEMQRDIITGSGDGLLHRGPVLPDVLSVRG